MLPVDSSACRLISQLIQLILRLVPLDVNRNLFVDARGRSRACLTRSDWIYVCLCRH